MGKIVECHKVNPSSDCTHVVRRRDEDEVMQKAEMQLMAQVRSSIEDEPQRA